MKTLRHPLRTILVLLATGYLRATARDGADPTNHPPTFAPPANRVFLAGQTLPPVVVDVTDADGDPVRLEVSLVRGPARAITVAAATNQQSVPGLERFVVSFGTQPAAAGVMDFEIRADDGIATNRAAFRWVVQPAALVRSTVGPTSAGIGMLDWVDTEGKGLPDLVAAPVWNLPSANRPRVLTNLNGRLPGSLATAAGGIPELARWDDFDGDGHPDVMSVGEVHARYWRPPSGNPGGEPTEIAWQAFVESPRDLPPVSADFDGDGRPDVLLAGLSFDGPGATAPLAVYNLGSGWFTVRRIVDATSVTAFAAGDIDGDGRVDLLLAENTDPSSPAIHVWTNVGNGQFVRVAEPVAAGNYVAVGLVDVDGDGHPEVWTIQSLAATATSPPVRRFAIHGATAFGYRELWSSTVTSVAIGRPAAAFADFDGDGYPDLVTFGSVSGQDGWYLFRNDGTGQFEPISYLTASQLSPTIAIADTDGDTRPDLILGDGPAGSGLGGQYFTNVIPAFAFPPATPRNCWARIDGTTLELEWDPGPETFRGGPATYNVRAGFASGGNDVVPGLALADGRRRVTRLGNAGSRRSLSIDLSRREGDAVYWSVQAINAAGQGSAFAPESVVRVGLPFVAPVISGLRVLDGLEDQAGKAFFSVAAPCSPADIVVTATAEPDWLVARVGVPAGSGSERSVVVTPRPNANGKAKVTLVATGPGGLSTTNVFAMVFAPVADPPTLFVSYDLTGYAGEAPPPIGVQVSDLETPVEGLTFSAESLDPDILPPTEFRFRIAGTNLVIAEASAGRLARGTFARVRVTVTDPEGLSVSRETRIWVLPPATNLATEIVSFPVPDDTRGLSLGDWEGNGRRDLLALSGGRPVLRRNAGADPWPDLELPWPAGDIATSARWIDWDRDGRLDIAGFALAKGTNGWTTSVYVLRNRGGNWIYQGWPGVFGPDTAAADLVNVDDDGKPEAVGVQRPMDTGARLVAARFRDGAFETPVLLHEGAPPFVSAMVLSDGTYHYISPTFAAVDLDGDGRTDLVSSTWLHQVSGSTNYLSTPANWAGKAAWFGDLDRDGRPDVVADGTGANAFELRPAVGDAIGFNSAPFLVQNGARFVDVDGDGIPEVIHTGGSVGMRARISSGWGDAIALARGVAGSIEAGDVDGDGAIEIVAVVHQDSMVPQTTYRIVVVRPDSARRTAVGPAAPTGVHVVFEADETFVEWSPSEDDSARGATYNLRVGTAPGTGDLVAPESAADGARRVVRPGNAGYSHRRRVAGLAPGGRYFAAVQAVDASGRGGPFSAEIAIVVPARQLGLESLPFVVDPASGEIRIRVAANAYRAPVRWSATVSPAPLAPRGGPTVRGISEGLVEFGIPVGDVGGRGQLAVTADDAAGSRAEIRVPFVENGVPDGIDLRWIPVLKTGTNHPAVLPFRAMDPSGTWASLDRQSTTFPGLGNGFIRGVYPDQWWVPLEGIEGNQTLKLRLVADDGRAYLAEFAVNVAGAGTTGFRVLPNGGGYLVVDAPPGQRGVVEASRDLVHWGFVQSYGVPAWGTLVLDDLLRPGALDYGFLRLHPDP